MSQLNIDKLTIAILTAALAIGTSSNVTRAQQSTRPVFSQQQIALQQDSSLANTYMMMGKLNWKQNKFPEAIEILNKAMSFDPKNADAQFWRGMSYDSLKKYDLAIADFDRTIALDKEYGLAYYMRGMNYSTKKKYDLAINDLETATKLLKISGDNAYAERASQTIGILKTLK